jgi:hydroxyethylthiazole kinase-like uncharacterized protein yjeF
MELLTAAQMRAIEKAAIDSGEVTGLELMERAGKGVVEAVFEEWPELRKTSHRAVVLCGPGNNGGDGFVVARLLKEWGWEVEVFLHGDPSRLPPDARVNYERWGTLGKVSELKYDNLFDANANIQGGEIVVVDALFGTGLTRPLGREICRILDGAGCTDRYAWSRRVSVDVPSGLCSDSGRGLWEAEPLFPDDRLTVTFHRAKTGHFQNPPLNSVGSLRIKDIGLSEFSAHGLSDGRTQLVDSVDIDRLRKLYGDHKYSHGHALILTGGPGKTGAARLAARGALRIGAGLVTLGCPQQALWEVASQVTALMVRTIDGAPGLREMLEDQRLNAACLGPGLGLGADTQALVLEALKAKRATVLDADALTRFERHPEVLFEALHENCVLTPHAGEFRRLFKDIAEKLDAPATTGPAYSKVDAAREAAKRAGCTVLFKGPDTVIADQAGRCSINSSAYKRAAPWLATAGSGDVLAGFVTGLLARGFPVMQAAETAAWLHTECALSFGPGLIAEDLPEELPKVLKTLLETPA